MTQINPHTGQIRRGSPPAEQLYNLVKQNNVHTIVDIGTWKGLGSTKCILDGIIDSNKKIYDVYSIECNKLFYSEAKINLGFLPPNFRLLYGSTFNATELYSIRNMADVVSEWLEADIIAIQSAPYIYNQIPEKIDLIVIDGGEYSGEIEFKLFWKNSKYIYMDDINSFKNKANRSFVLNNPNLFNVLYDDKTTTICENLNFKK